ncbi:MAG: nitroreductase family deazaflavin-dependent oxidoreductase [Alphaproteobacteria bacterium]
MRTSRKDPAERSCFLRLFYRDWRPTRLGKIWNGTYPWIYGLGLTSQIYLTLQVKNRSTGRLGSTVLVVASYKGQRYIVSMLGNGSEWVRNVRVASGEAFIKRGRSRSVTLTEVPPQERAPILKAWCQVATSGRQHLPVSHDAPLSAFEAIAADYPVFRIDPAT